MTRSIGDGLYVRLHGMPSPVCARVFQGQIVKNGCLNFKNKHTLGRFSGAVSPWVVLWIKVSTGCSVYLRGFGVEVAEKLERVVLSLFFFLARMRKYLGKIMKACLGNGITGRISFVFGTEPKGVQCGYVLATI